MIRTHSVSKQFDIHWAVNDLNLQINTGELYCLLGPNGAGKTTTVKLLSGLVRPTKGSILIGGYDVEKDYVQVKNILGLIPDSPFLYPSRIFTLYRRRVWYKKGRRARAN